MNETYTSIEEKSTPKPPADADTAEIQGEDHKVDHGYDLSVLDDFNYYGYPVHPACDALPLMPLHKVAALAHSIDNHGLERVIVVWARDDEDGGDVLVDGRNRLRAIKLLGYEQIPDAWIEFRTYEDETDVRVDVEALNLQQRQMTDNAVLLTYVRLWLDEGVNLPRSQNRRTLKEIAAMCDVSVKTVKHASAVVKYGCGPLLDLVELHGLAVSSAADVARRYSAVWQQHLLAELEDAGAPPHLEPMKALADKVAQAAGALRRLGPVAVGDIVGTMEMVEKPHEPGHYDYVTGPVVAIYDRGAGRGTVDVEVGWPEPLMLRLDKLRRTGLKQQTLPSMDPDPAAPPPARQPASPPRPVAGAPGGGDDADDCDDAQLDIEDAVQQRQVIGERQQWSDDPIDDLPPDPYRSDDCDGDGAQYQIGDVVRMLDDVRGPRLEANGPMVRLERGDVVRVTGLDRDSLTGRLALKVRHEDIDWDFSVALDEVEAVTGDDGIPIGERVRYTGPGFEGLYEQGDEGEVVSRRKVSRGSRGHDWSYGVAFDNSPHVTRVMAGRLLELVASISHSAKVGDTLWLRKALPLDGVELGAGSPVRVVDVRATHGGTVLDVEASETAVVVRGLSPVLFFASGAAPVTTAPAVHEWPSSWDEFKLPPGSLLNPQVAEAVQVIGAELGKAQAAIEAAGDALVLKAANCEGLAHDLLYAAVEAIGQASTWILQPAEVLESSLVDAATIVGGGDQ